MTREAPARKVPRWILVVAVLFSIGAITRMLVQQRAQRKALRDVALISASAASANERDPVVTVDRDGRALAAWTAWGAGATSTTKLGVRSLARGAHAWDEPIAITSPEPLVSGPSLAATSDGAVWIVFAGTHLFASKAPPGGVAFGAPYPAISAETATTHAAPVAAAGGATAWVAFREDGPRGSAIVLASLKDRASGERSVVAEGAGLAGALPGICADGEGVTVVWIDPSRGVLAAAGTSAARPSSEKAVVVSAGGDKLALHAPACSMDKTDIVVLYGIAAAPVDPGRTTTLSSAVLAQSKDGGKTFGARTTIEEQGLVLLDPSLAREASGAIAVVYYASRDGDDALAALRWTRVPTVGGPSNAAREARAPLRFAPKKADHGWLGDRTSLASGSGLLGAAFVDNLDGAHVAFVEFGP